MHKYLKIIMFVAGAFAGIVALLGLQKLGSFETIATLLDDQEASAVVRNYGLLALGLVGIVTAMIRLSMANTQQRQDKRSDLFDRFQKSSEMLNSENMAVRQAGLYTLAEIAKEQPDEFYIMVQSLFCGFLRSTSTEERKAADEKLKELPFNDGAFYVTWPQIRADMADAIDLFAKLRTVVDGSSKIEKQAIFKPNLTGLFIPGADLDNVDFNACNLDEAYFADCTFVETIFRGASVRLVNMDRAKFYGCQMEGLYIDRTWLRWAQFLGGSLSHNHCGAVDFHGAFAAQLMFDQDLFNGVTQAHPETGIEASFPHFTKEVDFKDAFHTLATREE